MRVLVTGGAGFIGSHVLEALLTAGHQPTVLDDLSRGRRENVPAGVPLVVAGLTDPDLAERVHAVRPQAICHLAAQIDVRSSVSDPLHDARVNVLGTLALAEAARTAGVERLVFASSGGAAYGEAATVPTPESAAGQPLSPYAAAKLAAETYLSCYGRLHALSWVSLALANVYGPRQDPAGEAGVVALFTNALLSGQRATIYGDGQATRDYLYVGDVAAAFIAALTHGANQRLNIGTGRQTSVRELHTLLADLTGGPDEPLFAAGRPGELTRSALDARLAGQVLGWRPTTTLADGLAATVAWQRQRG